MKDWKLKYAISCFTKYQKIIIFRKQPLDKRPSSGYMQFGDVPVESKSDIPAPFSHLYKFKKQLQDDDEDNSLYIELVCKLTFK
jgi:hypothetical protein